MKPTLTVLCGLQGSGKSTYARKLEKEGYFVVSSDEIRKQYPNAYNNSLKQINQFISENKHKDDIGLLFFVASQKSLENMNNDLFSVCAAFSSTSIKTETLENNIKNNEEFQKALTYSNVYLVAVDMYE